jgi:hypothetical protein
MDVVGLRTRIAAAASLAVLFTQRSSMSSQSTSLAVTVTVVRSCSIQQPSGDLRALDVSCTRGATPGVMVSSSGTVVPVPPGRTVSVAALAAPGSDESQLVVINF